MVRRQRRRGAAIWRKVRKIVQAMKGQLLAESATVSSVEERYV